MNFFRKIIKFFKSRQFIEGRSGNPYYNSNEVSNSEENIDYNLHISSVDTSWSQTDSTTDTSNEFNGYGGGDFGGAGAGSSWDDNSSSSTYDSDNSSSNYSSNDNTNSSDS